MKVKLPKTMRVCIMPEEGVAMNPAQYEAEVQVLDGSRVVLWFTDKAKKRLRNDEHLISSGLVLMIDEDNKED